MIYDERLPYVEELEQRFRSKPRSNTLDAPLPPTLRQDWADFLASEHQRLPGLPLYSQVFEHNGLFPLQRQKEMEWMINTASLYQPKVVMDIGSDKGGGVYHWVKSLPYVQKVIACEIRGTPYAEEFEKAFPQVKFLWLPCSSRGYTNAIKPVEKFLMETPGPKQIDCLFIDGDKTAFLEDFHIYHPYINRERGVVFLHDVTDPDPGKAFGELRRLYPRGARIFRDVSEVQPALDRQTLGLPPASAYEGWLRHWRGQSCGVGYIPLGVDLLTGR